MKMTYRILLLFVLAISVQLAAEPLVVRQDFEASPRWQLKEFSGQTFWPLLKATNVTHPAFQTYPAYSDIVREPVFRNCALTYINYGKTLPAEPVTVQALFSPGQWQAIQSDYRPGTPFLLRYAGTRPPLKLKDHYEHDTATYRQWLAEHPGFIAFEQAEWDNELTQMEYYISHIKSPDERQEIAKRYPSGNNRDELLATARKMHTNITRFFFNDPTHVAMMRAGWCLDHLAAEWGSKLLVLETTNTTAQETDYHYRWQVSMFFTRGAARQYGVPWSWYIANFYNGYASNGEWQNNNFHNYFANQPNCGPDKGMSQSLYRKAFYLAYLGGASFVEPEEWTAIMLRHDKSTDKIVLSPFGLDLREFYEFTTANPARGVAYAPVALLIPFNQGYPNWGGHSWSRFEYTPGDYMIDAFMATIVSPFNRRQEMKKGVEGALFNSPHGDIFDVLNPDVPSVSQALPDYKAAVLLGEYRANPEMAQNLIRYVENGGTLLINLKQLSKYFPESFTGISRTGAHAVTTFQSNSYRFEKIKLRSAEALLRDDQGNILATANRFGKGRVIVTTPDYLVPPLTDATQNIGEALRGERSFELIQHFVKLLSTEVLPVGVNGDIQYGLNKTPDGYWLYLFNNKGVHKFVDTPQTIDPAARSTVKIDLKNLNVTEITELRSHTPLPPAGKTLEISVDAGDFKILRLKTAN